MLGSYSLVKIGRKIGSRLIWARLVATLAKGDGN